MTKQYELIDIYFTIETDSLSSIINSLNKTYKDTKNPKFELLNLLPGKLESHQSYGSYHMHLIDKKTKKRINYRLTQLNRKIYIEQHAGQIVTKRDPITELFNSKGSLEKIIYKFEQIDESEFIKPSKDATPIYDLERRKKI